MKAPIVVLSIVSAGLLVAVMAIHQGNRSRVQTVQTENQRLAAQWEENRGKFTEAQQLVEVLQTNLAARSEELSAASNELAQSQAAIKQLQQDNATTLAQYRAAEAELQQFRARVGGLENERDDLNRKMTDLNRAITALETQIAETQEKLASATADREVLLAELKQLQEERATLLAKFNDLATMKAQVAKLREERAINQRMAWQRSGVYARQGQKGAQMLISHVDETPLPSDNRLILELEQNGAGRVVPPPPAEP